MAHYTKTPIENNGGTTKKHEPFKAARRSRILMPTQGLPNEHINSKNR